MGFARLHLTTLERRDVPAILIEVGFGTLTVFGDASDNEIVISRDELGVISVNGEVPLAGGIPGGFPSVFNTHTITVFGLGGNDVLRLDEANGPLPSAFLFGGSGNDTLIGGSSDDSLFGQSGDDLFDGGAGGTDAVFGGSGSDTLRADGTDLDDAFALSADGPRLRLARGSEGDAVATADGVERVEVRAGGGADSVTQGDLTGTGVQELLIDLGSGDQAADRVTLDGTGGDDLIDVFAFGGQVAILGPTFVTIRGAEAADGLTLNTLGGDDRVEAGGVPAGVMAFTIDGGDGDDDLTGTGGADVIRGGGGSDFVDGQRGDDVVDLGDGELDLFTYRAGDGSDRVDGGAGQDALSFQGTSAGEAITLSADAGRFVIARDVDGALLDTGGLESFSFFSFGGPDRMVVNDLTGTGLQRLDVSLFDFGVPGGNEDAVVVNGTAGSDVISASSAGGVVTVAGLSATLTITGTAAAGDRLVINGFGGDDTIDASGLEPARMQFRADGGAGNDTFVVGPVGAPQVLEGGTGTDVLLVDGTAGDDVFTVSAGGGRLRVDGLADAGGLERVVIRTLAGADEVSVVGDLAGTGVTEVQVPLGQDGDADVVRVIGTEGIDVITAGSGFTEEVVFFRSLTVRIGFGDGPLDRIEFHGLGEHDAIEARLMFAGRFSVLIDGGDGDDSLVGTPNDDVLLGGAGDDHLTGGFGDDVAFGDGGDDTISGNSGDDVLDGGEGRDNLNGGPGDDVLLNGETVIP